MKSQAARPSEKARAFDSVVIRSADFLTSAVKPAQYPPRDFPEIAFAGRSNVGKSSLINTLLNRKRLVKTSRTPGRTQLINFFEINHAFRFVDLPGYGYARVPPAVQRQWGPMVSTYLQNRPNLRTVLLLMDIRRRPDLKDEELLAWLEHCCIAKQIVLTKADKLSKSKCRRQLNQIAALLHLSPDQLLLFSSKTRLGKKQLWQSIQSILTVEKPMETPDEK